MRPAAESFASAQGCDNPGIISVVQGFGCLFRSDCSGRIIPDPVLVVYGCPRRFQGGCHRIIYCPWWPRREFMTEPRYQRPDVSRIRGCPQIFKDSAKECRFACGCYLYCRCVSLSRGIVKVNPVEFSDYEQDHREKEQGTRKSPGHSLPPVLAVRTRQLMLLPVPALAGSVDPVECMLCQPVVHLGTLITRDLHAVHQIFPGGL